MIFGQRSLSYLVKYYNIIIFYYSDVKFIYCTAHTTHACVIKSKKYTNKICFKEQYCVAVLNTVL